MLGNYHPAIVHMPIALLAILPLFFLLAFVIKAWSRPLMFVILVISILGTLSLIAATVSGEAASEMISKSQLTRDALKTLNEHYEDAEQARLFYIIFCIGFGIFFWLEPRMHPKVKPLSFLAFAVSSVLLLPLLLGTAHHGGELVHKYGIHSKLFDEDDSD